MISHLIPLDLLRRVGTFSVLVGLLASIPGGIPHVFADRTFVPLPIFTTDPNERQTYGALFAIIDEQEGAFRSLLVPYVQINPLLGVGAAVHYERFLTRDVMYMLDAYQTAKNQADYRVRYLNYHLAEGGYLFEGEVEYENDRTARFFGLGASSQAKHETNYTARDIGGRFTLGRRLTLELVASLTERIHHVTIRRGAVTSLPFLQDEFTDVPGEEGSFVWAHRLALTYDSRNGRETPTRGRFGRIFVEVATDALGSEANFVRYGLEGRALWPHIDERLVTAVRGLFERVDGSEVPFFELSELGGSRTLRGFGSNRFLDEGRILLTVEERIKVFAFTYGNVRTDIELALFAEGGRVFRSFSNLESGKVQAVWGGGVRFVAASQIVAKIDVGIGSEGLAIFTGLDYPF
ncbi:MAG: BamA/TamA family outer membrane protein [Nitrospinae bacterium]|nr:BamA/TamA family outer membrane protein [Nitrospinota bacterium]